MKNKINYYYNNNVELLSDNLGTKGKNLSIVILTYNKSNLTIRLLNSIKKYFRNFEGDILVFDNDSEQLEKENLKRYLKNFPLNYKLYKSKKNLGISNGRKKAFSMVKKDWILSLDNDMYFIGNPLRNLNYCIDKSGAKFINLCAYNGIDRKKFINGGKFKVSKKDVLYVTADTFNNKIEDKIYFSTFIFGGSSLINKYSYDLIGGYDENFFVGYEDVDLSLRAYKAGMKIANINSFCLIHDHQILLDDSSKQYEKTRYNFDSIVKSANYFSKKYDYKYSVLSEGEKQFLNDINGELKNK